MKMTAPAVRDKFIFADLINAPFYLVFHSFDFFLVDCACVSRNAKILDI